MSAFEALQLPNGSVIPNRIAKAAMEENMADASQGPSAELLRLYQAWAEGGAGLLLTGNVMVDRHAMTGPGGVVLEDERQLDKFREWARICRSNGAQIWVQLNHPGRQMQANLGQQTVAPSAVALELGGLSKMFPLPKALNEAQIHELIQRFARSAQLAEQAGFNGVQIHAAHGYLLSQFLSPLSNKRTDSWGGSLENRARLLLEVVKAVRASVTPASASRSSSTRQTSSVAASQRPMPSRWCSCSMSWQWIWSSCPAAATKRRRCRVIHAMAGRWHVRRIFWSLPAR